MEQIKVLVQINIEEDNMEVRKIGNTNNTCYYLMFKTIVSKLGEKIMWKNYNSVYIRKERTIK